MKTLKLELKIAWRYLRSPKNEKFLSVVSSFAFIGIMLGVATLIIVMSVMGGFREEIFGKILGSSGHIDIVPYERAIPDYKETAKKVAENLKNAGAVGAKTQAMVADEVMLSARGRAQGGLLRGMAQADIENTPLLVGSVRQGSLELLKKNQVMIGETLARRLSLSLGDSLTITSAKGNIGAFGTMPRVRSYKIGALFKIGMHEFDSNVVILGIETAQNYLDLPNLANLIEVKLPNPDMAVRLKTAALKGYEDSLFARSWQEKYATLTNAVNVERNMLFIILTLIVLVAAFNIISGMVMLVADKRRDIAVLRTMGATRGSAMRIFMLAGLLLGQAGTLIGTGLGMLFCAHIEKIRRFFESISGLELFSEEIYFLSRLPAKVDAGEVGVIVVMAIGLSFAATIYPAYKAAKLDPAEALKYE